MTYPYSEGRTYIRNGEYVEFVGSGTATASPINHTINLPPGTWDLTVSLAVAGTTAAGTATLYAFLDEAQTAVSGAITMKQLGTASGAATQVITTGTNAVDGAIGKVVPSASAAANNSPPVSFPYGLRLAIDGNNAGGTYSYKVMAQARS